MNGALWWRMVRVCLCWHMGTAWSQADIEGPGPEMALVSLGWDQGCLTRAECAMLEIGFSKRSAGYWTQQGVAALLPEERGREVIQCLVTIPEWRALFNAGLTGQSVPDVRDLRIRAVQDARAGGASTHLSMDGRMRMPSGLDLGGRMSAGGEGVDVQGVYCGMRVARREVWAGTMAGRFGQGLVLWTPGLFDDLGGIEGSHRVGAGVQAVRHRQRGVWDGLAWQAGRHPGRRISGGRMLGWCMLGRMWPDGMWSMAGGGQRGSVGWALRFQQTWDGALAAVGGLDGKGKQSGWNWRWACSVFETGWEGRLSILKSWSPRWEAHGLVHRVHPGHPRWHCGEVRVAPPDEASEPGVRMSAGIAFRGRWRGWWRVAGDWPGTPPFAHAIRTSLRLERKNDRLDIRTRRQHGPRLAGESTGIPRFLNGPDWSLTWRRQGGLNGVAEGTWRLLYTISGAADAGVRQACAIMVSWRGERKNAVRLGFGQVWGPDDAPLCHIQGWDGRPSGVFAGEGHEAFVRWRSGDGRWAAGLRISSRTGRVPAEPDGWSHGIHSVRVEFRPLRPPLRRG